MQWPNQVQHVARLVLNRRAGHVHHRRSVFGQRGEGIETGGRRRGDCQANVLEQRVETGGILVECGHHRLIGQWCGRGDVCQRGNGSGLEPRDGLVQLGDHGDGLLLARGAEEQPSQCIQAANRKRGDGQPQGRLIAGQAMAVRTKARLKSRCAVKSTVSGVVAAIASACSLTIVVSLR